LTLVFSQSGSEAQDKPQTGAGLITYEELGKLLDGLAYDFEKKERPDKDGGNFFIVKSADYQISVLFSGNKENIWLQISLVTVPDNVSATDRFQKMAEANFRYGRAAFRYWPSVKTIGMEMPIENNAVTPKKIRNGIDEFVGCIKSTANIWSGDWTKALAKDLPPSVAPAQSGSLTQPRPPK
jgi:hypothetical protein